ncbi:MAG TPA: cytochrome C oxidase subunit IV [Gammaproteobacteria bacterium]|jgi:cytochrome c oxidase subunit IV|nr:cytochrome C oxidase subunit IV [Gammaproteobacteria bacterium]HIL62276.1 cytochrome C oxidase subunit IV [Porticoccaceae bacterium]
MPSDTGQQHPLGIYYKIWVLLFVLSACSYAVDFFNVQGGMRWFLVLLFMFLKAGFIIAIFMHVFWERLALAFTILGPPTVLLLLIVFMAVEGNYTSGTRYLYMGHDPNAVALSPDDIHGAEHEEEEH